MVVSAVDLGAVLEVPDSEDLTHTQLPLVEVEPHQVATGPPHHNTDHQHNHP